MKNATLYTYATSGNTGAFIEANCEITGRGVTRHGNVNPTTILYTVTRAAFRALEKNYTILTKNI